MTPLSTYRLQLHRAFDFAAATRLVPYLRDLGVDWLYLSPIFAAEAGSMHGYDVIDPTVVNPELGGRTGLETLCGRAHVSGLGVLVDIVPNHEAATAGNARWRAALASHRRGWFDVDWPHGDSGEPRYRRFFDVDGLVGVRVEDDDVFRASHALVFDLLAGGVVDGLRVDHVDGLVDPAQYLARLRAAVGDAFVVVEKILARDERLPDWPVDGTTGYEAGDALTALCIDPDGRARLVEALLADNGAQSFAAVERASKELVLDQIFRPEWQRVLELLDDPGLAEGLRELSLALDVYRTYGATTEDRERLERGSRALAPEIAHALDDRLLVEPPTELVTRWRQLTAPVMAKGHEDTACYRFPALLAQNEVGGDPADDARDAVARFHARARECRGLIATSTHDSKRSEDVRARLCVLSEFSAEFEAGLRRWRTLVEPDPDVTAVELRFVAQSLLGAWPLDRNELDDFATRIGKYLTKALREAKLATTWLEPDVRHEQLVIDCALRTTAGAGRVLDEAFGPLVDDVMFFGALNSLAMLTWKLAMPGTPDVYRGSELWDLSLVDPDNRRPVDFGARQRLLASLPTPTDRDDPPPTDAAHDALLRDWKTGAVKLHLTATGLRARRRHPDLFGRGSYVALDTPPGVFGFARRLRDEWAVALAPRIATRVTTAGRWPLGAAAWGDAVVRLPDRQRTEIRLADAFATLPFALIVRSGSGRS